MRQRSPQARFKQSGFTLIEIMVVVTVIAIIMTTATLNVRIGDGDPPIKRASDRLLLAMQMISDESVLLNTSFGIKFYSTGYEVYRLKYLDIKDQDPEYQYDESGSLVQAPPKKEWRWESVNTLDKASPMRAYGLPDDLYFELLIEGQDIVLDEPPQPNQETDEEKIKPTLFLTPDGEIFPEFSVQITDQDTAMYTLELNEDGELSISQAKEGDL